MATKKKSTGKKAKSQKAAAAAPSADAAAAEQKFKRDLLIRGDAAPLDESGRLPLGATHEIVSGKEGEPSTVKIVRRRFNMS
jgi:hypothetical protein